VAERGGCERVCGARNDGFTRRAQAPEAVGGTGRQEGDAGGVAREWGWDWPNGGWVDGDDERDDSGGGHVTAIRGGAHAVDDNGAGSGTCRVA
jgi:hypothetical protein